MSRRSPSAQAIASKRQRRRACQSNAPTHFKPSPATTNTPRDDLRHSGRIQRARGAFPKSRLAGHVTPAFQQPSFTRRTCRIELGKDNRSQCEPTETREASQIYFQMLYTWRSLRRIRAPVATSPSLQRSKLRSKEGFRARNKTVLHDQHCSTAGNTQNRCICTGNREHSKIQKRTIQQQ